VAAVCDPKLVGIFGPLSLKARHQGAISSGVFANLLDPADARRATEVVAAVVGHGLRGALTGGLAIDAQLRAHGQLIERRRLNDIDIVVENFASIPEPIARSFLQHHVHPDATNGRTLLQLIDEEHRIRVDLFQTLGMSLTRAHPLNDETGELDVLSVEDLLARTTSLVYGRLRRGLEIDVKHVTAFERLRGLGEPAKLAAAWTDHRQSGPESLREASREAARLLEAHPELIVVEQYSGDPVPCERCRPYGPFRPATANKVVEILGYC
jgi:hypothetical protein